MVKIFLSGSGGCGKTTLAHALENKDEFKTFQHISEVARELMKKRRLNCDDLEKYDINQFISFQEDIIEAQCSAEEINTIHENVISDRSVLDGLAYALWRTGGNVDSSKVLKDVISRNRVKINESIERYRESLYFLVHPWNDKATKEDGVRLTMSSYDCIVFTSILKQLLQKFAIKFIEVKVPELQERIEVIVSALRQRHGQMDRNRNADA